MNPTPYFKVGLRRCSCACTTCRAWWARRWVGQGAARVCMCVCICVYVFMYVCVHACMAIVWRMYVCMVQAYRRINRCTCVPQAYHRIKGHAQRGLDGGPLPPWGRFCDTVKHGQHPLYMRACMCMCTWYVCACACGNMCTYRYMFLCVSAGVLGVLGVQAPSAMLYVDQATLHLEVTQCNTMLHTYEYIHESTFRLSNFINLIFVYMHIYIYIYASVHTMI